MDTLACQKLNQQTQEILVRAHALMVRRIAHHLLMRLPPSVQLDDLIQSGMVGLLEAVRHYNSEKGASFATYASIRIRGHMLDELRRNDWVPRSVYRNARMIAETIKKVEHALGREAKDHEIAEELDISINEYYDMIKGATTGQQYGFDDLGVTEDVLRNDLEYSLNEPHNKVLNDELMEQLNQAIEALPEKERLVLALYYKKDLNLKEIGEIIGVSESRISQIHSQATNRIKLQFKDRQ